MLEFRDFLAAHGFPWPLLSANLSAWAQFVCGGLFVVGCSPGRRGVVNFPVSLAMVHLGKTP